MRHLSTVLTKTRAALGRSLLSSGSTAAPALARVHQSMRFEAPAPASASTTASALSLSLPAVPSRSFTDKVSEETPLTETVRTFLDPADFYKTLVDAKMDFFCGVPDSLLKDICAYISDNTPKERHVIAANEGAAVGIATGYHLATRKFPVVYMQNSGFGNAVNPLLSLAHPKVYSIPMLLLIGWRGEPGKKDEPQHMVQGKVMTSLLADMNIPFEVLPDFKEGAEEAITTAQHYLQSRKGPYALLVKRQTFQTYKMKTAIPNKFKMTREEAIKCVVDNLSKFDCVVATTGFASRELYEIRDQAKQSHERDFLTVGSMGHASAIALGIAMVKPSRQIVCLDGDGALLMHTGSMPTIAQVHAPNLKHVLLNNGVHDSVGAQPSAGFLVDWVALAKNCGYKHALSASTPEEVAAATRKMRELEGPVFLEIKINRGARKNLGRPKSSPVQNKEDLMAFLDG